jgi:endonuclease-8
VPEGDTVWLSAKRMHEALAGKVLTVSDFRVPQHATADLTGRAVLDVVPRGKHMLTRVEGRITLHTHFRMAGTWRVNAVGARRSGGKAHEIRVLLANSEWEAVGYRIQHIELMPTGREADAVGHLGPDLLGPDWDVDEAVARLMADPHRPVGEALLDQRNLAGIGNIYKTETLFLSGLTPWTEVGDVGDLPALVGRAHRLMTANLTRREPYWIYDRGNRGCRRCGGRIRRAMQGTAPYARVCYWCPACQAGPSPESGSNAAATRPA